MRYLLIISLLLFVFSCKEKKEILPVDHFYDIKKSELLHGRLNECKGDAIEEAEKFVDALIDKWIKEQSDNNDDFPTKPPRPVAPEKIIGNK